MWLQMQKLTLLVVLMAVLVLVASVPMEEREGHRVTKRSWDSWWRRIYSYSILLGGWREELVRTRIRSGSDIDEDLIEE